MKPVTPSLLAFAAIAAIVSVVPLTAQSRAVTAADYDRASAQLAPSLTGLVSGGTVSATWLPDYRFWYRAGTGATAQTVLVDPVKKTRVVCDSARTNCPGVPAGADSAAGGRGGRGGGFGGGAGGRGGGNAVTSPDGKRAAFIRDWNLWVRDVAGGQEKKLTTDGSTNFGYATDNAGWAGSDRAILLW